MVERDIVLAKVATIDRCLRRIREARNEELDLRPQDAQDIVELNLQRGVQAAIDLAAHVVATEGLGLPGKLAESFTLLEREDVIDSGLAERLRKMAGFRNIAVHEYAEVDPEIVDSIVKNHLGDLRDFAGVVLRRFDVS
ncbi:MAG: type VII toxin-antitoxin system HepT family RNase toxin [Thermoanaerobaculia bacterium]